MAFRRSADHTIDTAKLVVKHAGSLSALSRSNSCATRKPRIKKSADQ
jgi:hypothetical protein